MVFEVTNTLDSGAGSLREAIASANSNPDPDTIVFADGVAGEIAIDPANGTLNITDDLTIEGPGADVLSVNGQDLSRIFAVLPADLASTPFVTPTPAQVASSPTVTIEALQIKNGLATNALGFDPIATPFSFGGGIFNFGGTLQLDSVRMSGNTAAGIVTAGGALANEFGGTVTVSNSHFDNNSSSGFLIGVGGAMTSDLGPTTDGVTGQPNVTVERSFFSGNVAKAESGYVDGVAFSGLGAGGAILNVTGLMTVIRSEFDNNSARGGTGDATSTSGGPAFGGAISTGDASPFGIAASNLEVRGSTFVENTTRGGDGGATNIPGGEASGGAIAANNGADVQLTRNKLRRNGVFGGGGGRDARGGSGAGGGVSAAGAAELTLSRNHFTANTAEGGAGSAMAGAGRGAGLALHTLDLTGFVSGPAAAESTSDQFRHNVVVGTGGGIHNEGELTLHRARLTANEAVGRADVLIDANPGYLFQGSAQGGGIANFGTLEMSLARLKGNLAIAGDTAIGTNVLVTPPTTPAVFAGVASGGGLHNVNEAIVSRSRFTDNEAVGGNGNQSSFAGVGIGGGIYNDAALSVSGTIVTNNLARGGDDNIGDVNAGSSYGGGIASGTVTALAGLRSASLGVDKSVVNDNQSRGGSGNAGLFPVPVAHQPSSGNGGGIHVYQGSATVSKSVVTNNVVTGGDDAYGAGGGIFFLAFIGVLDVNVTGSIISNNVATGGDGGNGLGGGIASGSFGSLFSTPANNVELIVQGSILTRNTAEGGGTGSDGFGGGLFNDSGSTLNLDRSLVFRNRAENAPGGDGMGGGVYNLGDVDLARSFLFANFASTSDDDCFGC